MIKILNNNKHLFFSLLLAIHVLTIASCSKEDSNTTDYDAIEGGTVAIDESAYTSGTAEGTTETGYDEEDILANSTFSKTVAIAFGSAVTVTNPYAGSGVTVTYSGQDVVVNSTISEVEYVLSGTATDGSIKIYSDKKFKLNLNGVSITNADGPAINIQSSKRVFVVLADNTSNSLTDGATYAAAVNGEDQKATFFSEGQLIFSGTGTLNVAGKYKHAICSDDYVRVIGGTINITEAASDGIHTNDAFIADGGTFNIAASSDGIEVEEGFVIINDGLFAINVVDDAITASYEEGDASIDPYVVINGGDFTINTTEGEGIESKSHMTINNGTIYAKTADDALNAGTALYINGGKIFTYSTGNDAIDSNGIITITGGMTIAVGSRSPEGGFDCDGNTFKITGGFALGLGGSTSGPTASVSTVRSVITGGVSANQIVHIEDASGNEVLTFLNPTSFSTMLFASSKMKASTQYNIYVGGSVSDATDFNGIYTAGTYTRGTVAANFTTSNMVTQIGGSVSRM
ncbi:carbohydrate-binding domain-containing protein, partial [Olivibacter sitiensis]|uniref:carbohydrate-binding domain-containing protein n=1 Tax=Olivibacter sitiensis TaxID=376470 RepID=UPI000429BDC7